jgi:hypothetical protein
MRGLEYWIREAAIDLNIKGPFTGKEIFQDPRVFNHPCCPMTPQSITQKLKWMGFIRIGYKQTQGTHREILWRCS